MFFLKCNDGYYLIGYTMPYFSPNLFPIFTKNEGEAYVFKEKDAKYWQKQFKGWGFNLLPANNNAPKSSNL